MLLIGTLVYTFGTLAFLSFFVFWLRERGTERHVHSYCAGSERMIGGVFLLVCTAWFATNFLHILASEGGRPAPWIELSLLFVAFLLPPTMMHNVYMGNESVVGRYWKHVIGAVYAVSFVSIMLVTGSALRWIENPFPGFMPSVGFVLNGLFVVAVGFLVRLSTSSRARLEGGPEGNNHLWFRVLMCAMLCLIVAQFLGLSDSADMLELALRSMPLCFLFLGQYYYSRFGFFDVFVKRGSFVFIVLSALITYFALVMPLVATLDLGWALAWVYALTFLPLALSIPWAYGKFSLWLDHKWLGRRFSSEEAIKYFLGGLGQATSEEVLIGKAEQNLADIFRSRVRIHLGPGVDVPEDLDAVEDVPIVSDGDPVGMIRMGPRENDVPYFGKDKVLLDSLAGVFASMLDNIHLQEERRELSIQASRSELKALRAQINPHFLFNALNALVGLIHKQPDRAEETVEGLADIFRYTLSRSDKEWARLEDEMEFLRAYLEVEQARFPQLEFRIHIDEEVRSARIPTMVVQTLVENAVKHGIAATRGPGRVEVIASLKNDRLRIEVRDNGPGFDLAVVASDPAPDNQDRGYGLSNVKRRLSGHFGDTAVLAVEADAATGANVVSVEMPSKRVVQTA